MIRLYVEISALLVASLLAFVCARWALSRVKAPVSSKHQLFLTQILFLGSFLVACRSRMDSEGGALRPLRRSVVRE